jgi:sortase A
VQGTVSVVDGDTLQVTTTLTEPTTFLGLIGISTLTVEGTGTADLRQGPGHYPATSMPGAPGTVGIAGHRTTYLAPFRHIDALARGDRIELRMPYGTFAYSVAGTKIVSPRDVGVLRHRSGDWLVLTACHPLYSAAQRIVVSARLVRARALVGKARAHAATTARRPHRS